MIAMTRRAAITAALTAAAALIGTKEATAAVPTYDPSTARALAIGAPEEGYVEAVAPSWDDDVATWNMRSIEERQTTLMLDVRDAIAALRPAPTRTIKIMCVGDSITSGFGATDGNGYRTHLTELLDRQGIAANLTVCAYPGQTLRYVAPIAIAQLPTVQPDIVLVHLGTNDAMQNDLGTWLTRYGQFLDQILASNPNVHVACGRISYGRDATVATREQTINGWISTAATTRAPRTATTDHTNIPPAWTVDGIHPGDAGYLRLAQNWTTTITPWLPA